MNRLLLLSAAVLLTACGSGETDKIGRASTVFNILGKNDRIEVEGFDDPDVQGVACYISYAKKGGLKEMVNLEEDASDASVSCVQTASSISFDETAVRKPKEVFKHGASFAFKSRQIVRYYDPKRKTFAYLVYSDKIIQGSPKNFKRGFLFRRRHTANRWGASRYFRQPACRRLHDFQPDRKSRQTLI